MDEQERAEVLACFGAQPDEIPELLTYNVNDFRHDLVAYPVRLPLEPEPHVHAWERYAAEAGLLGVFPVLADALVQLNFPIREGLSQSDEYRAAVRRGRPVSQIAAAIGLPLTEPEKLELKIHPSLAGLIPILLVRNHNDFRLLVQALTFRNEPGPVPDSQGACLVAGYNNWDRIRRIRGLWEEAHPGANSEFELQEEFSRLIPQKEKYQDRFIILSDNPYSGVDARAVGVPEQQWAPLSLTIRLEHECAHYLTRRLLSRMKNNILDELIADYCGIVAAVGEYRAEWFLRFLGLEQHPVYRPGGRLENYRGELSDRSFSVLQALVIAAARNVECFHRARVGRAARPEQTVCLALSLTRLTIEELAVPEGQQSLAKAWSQTESQVFFK